MRLEEGGQQSQESESGVRWRKVVTDIKAMREGRSGRGEEIESWVGERRRDVMNRPNQLWNISIMKKVERIFYGT